MKLNLELDKHKLIIIKRMIMQMKKVCPNQTIYITFDDDGIKLITEYNPHDLQYVDSFFNIGMSYFVVAKTLESKRAKNQITIKIKDFQAFVSNFMSIADNSTAVHLVLSKEQDQRYIKIKSTESDILWTTTRSEIYLHFEELTFPRIDLKRFHFQLPTRDLVRILDMCYKAQQPLYLKFRVEEALGSLRFYMRAPSVCMVYENLQTQDYNREQNGDVFTHNFCISEKHVKQLAVVAAIDEMVSISVLLDGGLALDFWELNEEQYIIAMKSFVVPQLDNVDNDDGSAMEQEQTDRAANPPFVHGNANAYQGSAPHGNQNHHHRGGGVDATHLADSDGDDEE